MGQPRKHGPGEGSWLEELFFEQTFNLPAEEDALPLDMPLPVSESPFDRAQLQGNAPNLPALQQPAMRRAFYRKFFASRIDRLVAKIEAEPIYASAFELWNPRDPATNRNVGREIARYLTIHTSQVFAFTLAPITFVATPKGMAGEFQPMRNEVEIELGTLRGRLRDFIHTVLHEQMHSYQTELISRLAVTGRPLSAEERVLAEFFRHALETYPTLSEEALRKNPEFRQRYLTNGLEEHANYVAERVVERVLR